MSNQTVGRPIHLLLVEDDKGDAELMTEVMKDTKIRVALNRVEDGEEAMKYLRKEGEYADAVRPDLILLDLNMPKKDGREVLNAIKNDEDLKVIPVVVLTTSDADEDILKTYALGASCYVKKPLGLEQFSKLVESIEHFWFTVVTYPPKEG